MHRQFHQPYFVKQAVAISDINASRNSYDISKATARQTLKKIKSLLLTATSIGASTRAHRGNLIFLIDNAPVIKYILV